MCVGGMSGFPFHDFSKISITYPIFSGSDETDLDHFPIHVFLNADLQDSELYKYKTPGSYVAIFPDSIRVIWRLQNQE